MKQNISGKYNYLWRRNEITYIINGDRREIFIIVTPIYICKYDSMEVT